jgi:hypothetical protein
MPTTREILKQEIDHIQDRYIDALYNVSQNTYHNKRNLFTRQFF